MRKKNLFLFGLSLGLLMLVGCLKQQAIKHPSQLDFNAFPLKNLSEYGFYEGELKDLKPAEGILAYEPIAPLFTDYAFKKRFVWMPKGTSADFDLKKPDQSFDFPEGSILIKNFYYPLDFKKSTGEKRILETRLLVKIKGKWEAYPYLWNEAQTDAKYKVTGAIIDVSWQNEQGERKNIKYAMPNKSQCKSCHFQEGKFTPIGPKLKQLNHAISSNGNMVNQLDLWQIKGYLKKPADKTAIVSLVDYNDKKQALDLRARSYLDVNCGHCHGDKKPAASSGLRLNFEENDPYHWGVKKSPVAAGIGAGDFLYDIYPGHGNESIITYRMASTNPGIMMPELGRVSVHTEGVELIKSWIDQLP